MDIYLKLFEVLFPVFFIVGIGYFLGKKNPKLDTSFITNFAANIGTPAMVFYSITTTGITFEILLKMGSVEILISVFNSIFKMYQLADKLSFIYSDA